MFLRLYLRDGFGICMFFQLVQHADFNISIEGSAIGNLGDEDRKGCFSGKEWLLGMFMNGTVPF